MIRFLNVGGESERRMGDLEDARALFERAVALVPHSPNRRKVASYVLHGLADVELLAGELDRAARHYREALVELGSMPDERLAVHPVAGLAAVAAAEGETERAGTLWGVAAAFERDVGLRLDEFERHDYETTLDQVAGPAFQLGFERGTTMTYDQAVAYALGSG